MAERFLKVELRRMTAIVRVETNTREFEIIECSNANRCQFFGNCPMICEIVVCAKDYIYGRRKPKGKVSEIVTELL